jgi:hypothetical protein
VGPAPKLQHRVLHQRVHHKPPVSGHLPPFRFRHANLPQHSSSHALLRGKKWSIARAIGYLDSDPVQRDVGSVKVQQRFPTLRFNLQKVLFQRAIAAAAFAALACSVVQQPRCRSRTALGQVKRSAELASRAKKEEALLVHHLAGFPTKLGVQARQENAAGPPAPRLHASTGAGRAGKGATGQR